MKHYTSYYANYKNIPSNYFCIGISRYFPDWFKAIDADNIFWDNNNWMAPSKELLLGSKNGSVDISEYTRRYREQIQEFLNKSYRTLNDFINMIDSGVRHWGNYNAIVFMCYEKPGDFCHRHIFSDMLNECGIECEELILEPATPVAKPLF